MRSEHDSCYPFDWPGVYEIHLLGSIDPALTDYLGGMTSVRRTLSDGSGRAVTVLAGWLPDQAALNGVLNALYDRRYTLVLVRQVTADRVDGA